MASPKQAGCFQIHPPLETTDVRRTPACVYPHVFHAHATVWSTLSTSGRRLHTRVCTRRTQKELGLWRTAGSGSNPVPSLGSWLILGNSLSPRFQAFLRGLC